MKVIEGEREGERSIEEEGRDGGRERERERERDGEMGRTESQIPTTEGGRHTVTDCNL